MATSRLRLQDVFSEGSGIDDTLTPTDHDANAVDHADTVNYLASQIADILGEVAWENAPDDSIANLAARTNFADKLALRELQLLTDISVTAAQNWEALSVAGSEVPAGKVKAIGASQRGLVTALHAGTWNTHSLDEVAGDNALSPKNLLAVVDGATGDPILTSGGYKIWALLQHESGATDATAFTDTTPERAQVSFVIPNATHDDLIACPVGDIAGKTVNLSFVEREDLDAWTEQDFLRRSTFVDIGTGAASVNLDNAIDNQGATPATQATNIFVRIDDSVSWNFADSTGGKNLLKIAPAAAGDEVEINVDTFDVNVGAAGVIDFDNGATVDSGGQSLNLGVTAGQVDSTTLKLAATTGLAEVEGVGVTLDGGVGAGGAITMDGTVLDADFSGDADSHLIIDPNSATLRTLLIAARNAGAGLADLELEADGEVYFETVRQTTRIPLDDATAGSISALAGGPHASISAAIKYALENGGVDLTFDIYVAAGNFATGVNIPAVTQSLVTFDGDMGTPGSPGTPDLFLFLNGRLIRGAAATGTGDWYPGTTPASGDIKVDFPKGIKTNDVILTIALAQ
jgi:hypothetical protein